MWKCVFVASRIAFALAVMGVTSANAADLGRYRGGYKDDNKDYGEPIVVPPYFSWTGFYIGGHLGYGWGSSSSFETGAGNGDAFDGLNGFTTHPYGWMGGVSLGYNWQSEAFVFGLEADLGYLGAEDSASNAEGFASAEYGVYGTLTARIGYAEDRWLFYGKGGIAFADIGNRAGAITAGAIDPTDVTSVQDVRAGWALGAGVEYAFQRDLSMKIEYLYMDFGSDRSGNLDGDIFGHENNIHTVKVGLNYSLQRVIDPLK